MNMVHITWNYIASAAWNPDLEVEIAFTVQELGNNIKVVLRVCLIHES
jgi:hypothetical protein